MTAANVTARIPHRIRRLVLSGAAGVALRDPKMKPLATWRFATTEAELAKVQRQNVGILMLHDPASVDDLAVNIQMRNGMRTLSRKPPRHFTTLPRWKRRSRAWPQSGGGTIPSPAGRWTTSASSS